MKKYKVIITTIPGELVTLWVEAISLSVAVATVELLADQGISSITVSPCK